MFRGHDLQAAVWIIAYDDFLTRERRCLFRWIENEDHLVIVQRQRLSQRADFLAAHGAHGLGGCDERGCIPGLSATGSHSNLAPGDIVIMDNLPAHKAEGVRHAIKLRGVVRSTFLQP